MVATLFARTIWATQVYQPLRPDLTALSGDWTVLGIWRAVPPTSQPWWMAASIDADADAGTGGEIRLRAGTGGEFTTAALIDAHVERVLIGWEQLNQSVETLIFAEGRRTSGTAGGIRLKRCKPTLMSAPPVSQQGGPTYPPGYVVPLPPPYPPDYETADYG